MSVRAIVCGLLLAAHAAVAVAQPIPEASPESVGLSAERLARIEKAVMREIAQDRMPGAVLAIARRGKLAYYAAFGYLDKAKGIPMSKDAIFSIASMTKPIFAVAAMSLHEEGRLLLDEPVATYLPELGGRVVAIDDEGLRTEPARRQPTIEDLLRHTSGFVNRGGGESALHDRYPGPLVSEPLTGAEYLKQLASLPLR
jgi:CubicO group peptidase (beta-lactamase class C family)